MASSDQKQGKMQFLLLRGGGCGPRLGQLVWHTVQGQGTPAAPPLDTPLCLLYSRGGAMPHLTRDLEEEVLRGASHVTGSASFKNAVLLTMPTMYRYGHQTQSTDILSQFGKGIHSFLNREHQLLCLSVQDPGDPTHCKYNDEKSVSVWSKHGRSKVSVPDHVRLLRAFRPNIFECLYDSAPSEENKMKRIRKSVDRTLRFLDETIAAISSHEVHATLTELSSCSVLGAVVGSDVLAERVRSAKETAARPVDGFVLEGFGSSSRECLGEMLTSANERLPEHKPRFVQGIHTPECILEAVRCGVDVFEMSHAYTAAEKGVALVFPLGQRSRGRGPNGPESAEFEYVYEESHPFEMDLNDEKYKADFNPFLPGCQCYACSHHTRAYTHHLLGTNEILAKILLMMHNVTHYLTFFALLRDAIRTSSYEKFRQSCLHKN